MASAAWKNRMGFTLVETLLVIVILAALLAVSRMTVEQLELNLLYEFSDFIRGDAGQYYCDYAMCPPGPAGGRDHRRDDHDGRRRGPAAGPGLHLSGPYGAAGQRIMRSASSRAGPLLEQTQALIAQQQQMERELADLPAGVRREQARSSWLPGPLPQMGRGPDKKPVAGAIRSQIFCHLRCALFRSADSSPARTDRYFRRCRAGPCGPWRQPCPPVERPRGIAAAPSSVSFPYRQASFTA